MNFIQTYPETRGSTEGRTTSVADYRRFDEAVLVDTTTLCSRAENVSPYADTSRTAVVFGLDAGRAEEMQKALIWYAENVKGLPTVATAMELAEDSPGTNDVKTFYDRAESEVLAHRSSEISPLIVISGIERFIGSASQRPSNAQKESKRQLEKLMNHPNRPVICALATCKYDELTFSDRALGPLSKFTIKYATSDLASQSGEGFELLPSAKTRNQ